jgi:exonuclease SbcD
VRDELATDRSHACVLQAACQRVLAHARGHGFERTVVAAHAFVAGGAACQSERAISVGGIGDTPSAALDGPSYVALGHLHRPQEIALSGSGSGTRLRYSGSPLAYSFSERSHDKSVSLVELDARGVASVEPVAAPVPRPLVEVRGTLEELVASGRGVGAAHARSWVRAVITDRERPLQAMEALRAVWPHTVELSFEPEGATGRDPEVVVISATTDPVDVCARFVAATSGDALDESEAALLREAVETSLHRDSVA